MDRRAPRRAAGPPHGPGDVRGALADGAVGIGGRRAAEPHGRAAEDRPVADAARTSAWPNARVVAGDPATVIENLKQADGDPLRTIGSVSLVRNLLSLGLVDRLRLVVFPIVLERSPRLIRIECGRWRPPRGRCGIRVLTAGIRAGGVAHSLTDRFRLQALHPGDGRPARGRPLIEPVANATRSRIGPIAGRLGTGQRTATAAAEPLAGGAPTTAGRAEGGRTFPGHDDVRCPAAGRRAVRPVRLRRAAVLPGSRRAGHRRSLTAGRARRSSGDRTRSPTVCAVGTWLAHAQPKSQLDDAQSSNPSPVSDIETRSRPAARLLTRIERRTC